jgi:hypothetical protein
MQSQIITPQTEPPENKPSFYLEISVEPGFSKFKPQEQITFYQPNLKPHTGTACQIFGACGLHLAAFQPSIDLGIQAGIAITPKIAFSTGFFYSIVQGKLGIDGILFACDADDKILSNTVIDSAYAFSHILSDMNEVFYKADYFMIPLLFHFNVPGEKLNAGIEIGTRQYFLINGSLSGDEYGVTIIHNSYGFGTDELLGNKTIDLTDEMRPYFIALNLGAEFRWQVNDHLNFLVHPYWIRGFFNLMQETSEIFIAQYGSTSNFEINSNVIPLNQDFRFRKFGLGLGLQYEF